MTAEETVRDYYEALRRGEPLYPYFAESSETRKFGISDALSGYDEIAEALREQSRRTDDWTVESEALSVTDREQYAWFADEVRMAWSDTGTGERFSFDARWSGTLERRGEEWLFVSMHVSAPHRL